MKDTYYSVVFDSAKTQINKAIRDELSEAYSTRPSSQAKSLLDLTENKKYRVFHIDHGKSGLAPWDEWCFMSCPGRPLVPPKMHFRVSVSKFVRYKLLLQSRASISA
jgi:hypothetical protein